MIPDYIQDWVDSGESETLELKRSTGRRREAAQSVCAMLNHRGGRVIIGVEPDGTIIGQQIGEQTIERLCQELEDIDPPALPSVNVDRESIGNGHELLIISVRAGQNKPYTYQRKTYRRVGNTNRILSRDEYNQLLLERLHAEHRWENEPAQGWSIDDLDHDEIARTVSEGIRNGRIDPPPTSDPVDILRRLGLIRDDQLLRAAVVLFKHSRYTEPDYPQCMLRVAKFRGIDRNEFLDNRQFYGNAFYLLERAQRFLIESLPIAGRIMPGVFKRVDEPLYPTEALREALANAFCHRDYSIGGGSVAVAIYDDRLEITSSGTLHFGLTAQSLFETHESLQWNPLIARVFYRRGIIETWGSGIRKMVDLVTQAGLPRLEIEEIPGCVVVRFRQSRYVPPQRVDYNLTERQRLILSMVSEAPDGLALREMYPHLEEGLTRRQVQHDLDLLRSLNLVILEGRGPGARWKLMAN